MKKILFPLLAFLSHTVFGQSAKDSLATRDTSATLNNVTVVGYLGSQPLLRTAAAVSVISRSQFRYQPPGSLVPVFNTVPGVRMEERSPGSYRLSLRGSLLRSPFGVRNVKVYMNDYPLTDAGGNTYLNSLSLNSVEKIEVLRGPDGSLFGANSNGVVIIQPDRRDTATSAQAGISGGSYGLFNEDASLATTVGKHTLNVKESYQRSDGYRQNTAMHRAYLQASDTWRYHRTNELQALVWYSDLAYRTPAGLTLAQFEADPRSARPATATLPGAIEQKAGVYNKMFFAGLTHKAQLTRELSNMVALFTSNVNFSNPFITNYEQRSEFTYGGRTYFNWHHDFDHISNIDYNLGTEWQQTVSDIHNYDNNRGQKGALQAYNNILSDQHFFFARLKLDLVGRLNIEGAISLNDYSYNFRDTTNAKKVFDPRLMPRLATSFAITDGLIVRGTVSRGYSAPTTAEVRPSDNRIYQHLQAELGWNYEAGLRVNSEKARFWADLSAFHYRLDHAIVRQLNANATEYFVNAGGTNQNGIELQASYRIIRAEAHVAIIKSLVLNNSTTLSHFKFRDYQASGKNYSGNWLTGVPRSSVVSSVLAQLPASTYLFVQHNYTSRLPLNDANSAYANKYDLVQLKAGWQPAVGKKGSLEIFAGVDNLLNEKYSLGNDLNAVGNRYYNAAPPRNYFAGVMYHY